MNILLQGAMNEEVDLFLEYFKPLNEKNVKGFLFYISNFKGNKIIISKIKKGIINATMATTIALMEFKIDLVINQGCAGAHKESLKVGDIILGEKTVYINDFKSKPKALGEGSNSLDWLPNTKRSYVVFSTEKYLKIAKDIKFNENIVVGTIGSGDLHSREVDRILYLKGLFGEDCEDMETVASLKVCENFGVDRLALRVISNNELLSIPLDKRICRIMQEFVVKLVNEILK